MVAFLLRKQRLQAWVRAMKTIPPRVLQGKRKEREQRGLSQPGLAEGKSMMGECREERRKQGQNSSLVGVAYM